MKNRRRPPGPYGAEWVIVWGMFLLTLACMLAALYGVTASAANFMILSEQGAVIAECESPLRIDYGAVAAVCRVPVTVFADGFE